MGWIGNHISGLIFGFSFFLGIVLAGVVSDKIDITVRTSFETQYKDCQQKLSYFEQQKQVVCEAKQPSVVLPMLSGFMAGGLSVGWLMLFGYPLIKDKLEKRRNK